MSNLSVSFLQIPISPAAPFQHSQHPITQDKMWWVDPGCTVKMQKSPNPLRTLALWDAVHDRWAPWQGSVLFQCSNYSAGEIGGCQDGYRNKESSCGTRATCFVLGCLIGPGTNPLRKEKQLWGCNWAPGMPNVYIIRHLGKSQGALCLSCWLRLLHFWHCSFSAEMQAVAWAVK